VTAEDRASDLAGLVGQGGHEPELAPRPEGARPAESRLIIRNSHAICATCAKQGVRREPETQGKLYEHVTGLCAYHGEQERELRRYLKDRAAEPGWDAEKAKRSKKEFYARYAQDPSGGRRDVYD
jgi:hypothetical protein